MSRKLLVISSLFVAVIAVNFNTSDAEAARCCRTRGRCCGGGWGGGWGGGCYSGGCGGYAHRGCGWGGGYASYSGCNSGCNVAYTSAYNQGCNVQPCGYRGGCAVQNGNLYATPMAPAVAPPAPARPYEAGNPNAPAPANNPPPAPGT